MVELDLYRKAIRLGIKKEIKSSLNCLIVCLKKSSNKEQVLEQILLEEIIDEKILINQSYNGKVINYILFNEYILPYLIYKINEGESELYCEYLYYLFGNQESIEKLFIEVNGLSIYRNDFMLKGFVEFVLAKYPFNIKFRKWYATILYNDSCPQ